MRRSSRRVEGLVIGLLRVMEPPTRIPSLDQPLMELDEWASLPEDAPGELVEGRLEEEEMPEPLHELAVIWLGHVFRMWLSGRGGFVLGSDAKFAIGRRRGRKPDLSVFLPGGAVPPRHRVVRKPPDIAVEILTATPRDIRRDRIDKMNDYAAFGVRWYWILDPEQRVLEIYELGSDGRYARALGATGRVSSVPGCAALDLDLPSLWAEIDRLGPDDPIDDPLDGAD
jgi:Uma2 family endonuclease